MNYLKTKIQKTYNEIKEYFQSKESTNLIFPSVHKQNVWQKGIFTV